MSVVEKLEEQIKKVIRDFGTVENNYDARNLWQQIQEKITDFKKACVIVPRKPWEDKREQKGLELMRIFDKGPMDKDRIARLDAEINLLNLLLGVEKTK